MVYRELRRRAAAYLRRERRDHALQPSALVHEAFLRLIGQDRVTWQNRGHFYGIASQMMRRILVDHAREHRAAKRPGTAERVELDDRVGFAGPPDVDVSMLDQALTELAAMDVRQAQIVSFGTSAVFRKTKWPPPCRSRALRSPGNGSAHAPGSVTA